MKILQVDPVMAVLLEEKERILNSLQKEVDILSSQISLLKQQNLILTDVNRELLDRVTELELDLNILKH